MDDKQLQLVMGLVRDSLVAADDTSAHASACAGTSPSRTVGIFPRLLMATRCAGVRGSG